MKRPAVFFDRDNTLIVSDGYLGDPNKVVLVDGAADAVARCKAMGFAAVVFSNQSGVARGYFNEEAVFSVNQRMDELLQEDNPSAVIDRHEFCPFHPQAPVTRFRKESELRKPKPGMIYQAARTLDLDLSKSWVVGDAPRDIDAGHAAGLRTVLLKVPGLPPSVATTERLSNQPDYFATSLAEAIDFIDQARPDEERLAAPASAGTVAAAEAGSSQFDSIASTATATEEAPAATVEPTSEAVSGRQERPELDRTPVDEIPALSDLPREEDTPAAEPSSGETSPAVASAEPETALTPSVSTVELETAEPAKQESTTEEAESAADNPASAAVEPGPTVPVGQLTTEAVTQSTAALSSSDLGATEVNQPPGDDSPSTYEPEMAERVSDGPKMTWGERMRLARAKGMMPAKPITEPLPEDPPLRRWQEREAEASAPEPTQARALSVAAAPVEPVPPTPEQAVPVASPTEPKEEKAVMSEPVADHPAEPVAVETSAETPAAEPAATPIIRPAAKSTEPVLADTTKLENLLDQVLQEIRRSHEPIGDFSMSKVVAGVFQILSLAALIYAVALQRDHPQQMQTTLLIAIALQTFTVSMLIMGRQK